MHTVTTYREMARHKRMDADFFVALHTLAPTHRVWVNGQVDTSENRHRLLAMAQRLPFDPVAAQQALPGSMQRAAHLARRCTVDNLSASWLALYIVLVASSHSLGHRLDAARAEVAKLESIASEVQAFINSPEV